MKMNSKQFQYYVIAIIAIAFYFLFGCSNSQLPKSPKVISYIIWDKEKPSLFDLTMDYSYQEDISLSNLTLYKIEKVGIDDLGKFFNKFSKCPFGLIPRKRGDFSINDAPLIIMLVEDSFNHSHHLFSIGINNTVSKTVFIRKTKLFFNDLSYVEYENEGCYQDKSGYQEYVQLIQGYKTRPQKIPVSDVFKEYRSHENTLSKKSTDLYLRFLFISFAFFGGIGSALILLMLPNRTRNFSRKKKFIIATLYGMFCLMLSALLFI
ncbi:putative lipoprotein [Leptospira noguchii str. 1993005606]|nr:hypothetical protein [Leptospira noguchii]EPE86632.1 putative lipoprotein [Leptospira noguchii str. 1993005606]